jgi:penicillin-binding protein 1A
VQAVLAAEDERFYHHPGVDWQAIIRAAIELVKTGEKRQGGSTITMQVARNFFLTREKTYLRKLNEILLALKIERELSKDAILELYLNKIYLGHRAYGVGAAAQVYYGRKLDELTLPQIAMIAGLPKAPSALNPVTDASRALQRRNYVLGRMYTLGQLSEQEFKGALATPVTARLHGLAIAVSAPYVAEMVRGYMTERYGEAAYTAGYRVITTVSEHLQSAANRALRGAVLEYDRRHGYRGPEHHNGLNEAGDKGSWLRLLEGTRPIGGLVPGLVVEVGQQSIDVFAQALGRITIGWEGLAWARAYVDENRRGPEPKSAAEIVQVGDVIRVQRNAGGTWRLAQVPEVEGALVALSPNDGAVLALSGGFAFVKSKFNRVTQGYRQPGSNFKPFIYSAALESGFTAASLINDAPVVIAEPGQAVWRPENYTGKFYGPTRLRDALTFSRNVVSVRLLRSMGIAQAIDHITRFGFDPRRLPRTLSLALGSASVSPLQLAGGYAVLANGGYRVRPYFIDRIEAAEGSVVMQHNPAMVCHRCERLEGADHDPLPESVAPQQGLSSSDLSTPVTRYAKRTISARNAWLMTSMMRDVIRRGTGKRARALQRADLAGKTGTTNAHKDTWFSGFNSSLVATTWVGFDDNRSLGKWETGASAALPMWVEFMKTALEGVPESTLPQPAGLVTVRIDPDTGLLANTADPKAMFESFYAEQVPTRFADTRSVNGDSSLSDENNPPEQLF